MLKKKHRTPCPRRSFKYTPHFPSFSQLQNPPTPTPTPTLPSLPPPPMEENPELIFDFKPPSLVKLSPFTPIAQASPQRLSSCFSQPATPIKSSKSLAWVSLQGRLVNADEATSAKAVGGGLRSQEAVAWELFSPIHRVLIVAVVSVAAMSSRKNREIGELKRLVELRDQMLSSMQQKLDELCEQLNFIKDNPEAATDRFTCQKCENQKRLSLDPMGNRSPTTWHEVLNISLANEAEPEERRMSDLSDWSMASSLSLDIQLNTEQEVYNLQKECEEKDTTIKELSTLLHSSDTFGSKRTAELEEIIRRKNMMINRFKKDIMVLEQKVVNLTRIRRPSYKNAQTSERQLPFMAENVMYDMDSSTSSSSSDTDGNPKRHCRSAAAKVSGHSVIPSGKAALKKKQNTGEAILSSFAPKQAGQNQNTPSSLENPLKEMSLNETIEPVPTLKAKYASSIIEDSRSRRRPQVGSKSAIAPKRWV